MLKVFVSYTNADRHWAEWIAWQIEAAGHDVRFQPWDFVAGANFIHEMQTAIEWSDVTVMVLSEAYLASKFCQVEWYAGLLDDPVGEDRKLLPFRIEPCRPQGLLKAVVYTDLMGLSEVDAQARILRALKRGRQKPAQEPSFPGSEPRQPERLEKPPAAPPSFPVVTSDPPSEPIDESLRASDSLDGRYDVFLSYAPADKASVESIAERVKAQGVTLFLDTWHLVPGEARQEALEAALERSKSCAVFVGPDGIGGWQNEEMRDAIAERVRNRGYRVIPVLLPSAIAPKQRALPRFLRRTTWVDFRAGLNDVEAFERLLWGIRGTRTPVLPTASSPPECSETSSVPESAESNTPKDLAIKLVLSWAVISMLVVGVLMGVKGCEITDVKPLPVSDLIPGVLRISAIVDGVHGAGTGFAVAIDGETAFVATAAHVIAGSSEIEIDFPQNVSQSFPAEVVRIDHATDLALLRVPSAPVGETRVLRVSDRTIEPGASALVVGYPNRAPRPRSTTVTLTGIEGAKLVVSGLVTSGSSGSPVLADGLVIGLLTESRREFQNAVPGKTLVMVLENWLPSSLAHQFQE